MSQVSFCLPNATTCSSLGLLSSREYFESFGWSRGATQGKLSYISTYLASTDPSCTHARHSSSTPRVRATAQCYDSQTISRQSFTMRNWSTWPHLHLICFPQLTKEQVKSLVNTAIICSKREAGLIYIAISKQAKKGCHLGDLMFPDSSELAFIGTLCTFTRKKSWHKGYKTALADQWMSVSASSDTRQWPWSSTSLWGPATVSSHHTQCLKIPCGPNTK